MFNIKFSKPRGFWTHTLIANLRGENIESPGKMSTIKNCLLF